ncbi:MAG: hypothetical protein AB8F34_06650 [Akkermansiaceae bacterium]
MNTFSQIGIFVALSMSLVLDVVAGENKPEKLPAGFRFIGTYKMVSKIKVERGESMPVLITPLIYRVYSDGIEVRVYCRTAGEDSHTAYQIYRSDGVGVPRSTGEIDLVAGVQALSTKAEMVRQLSVTRASMTMVKAPPRSHRVVITRALALKAAAAAKDE